MDNLDVLFKTLFAADLEVFQEFYAHGYQIGALKLLSNVLLHSTSLR